MEEASDSEYEETYVLVDLDCCLDALTIKPGKILGIKVVKINYVKHDDWNRKRNARA